jgi:hypothetical protein
MYAMMWWHPVILVLVADMRDGVFEGDENRTLICWYEVSCSLLLINLLAWVLERLNARLPSTLLMTSWFVCPLCLSKCFYCRSFLWHLSHFLFFPLLKWWFDCSQVHMKPWTGTTYIHSFLQNVNAHIPEGI